MRSPGLTVKGSLPAVPAGHHQLSLVVRVDQPDQIAEHDAVLVAESRARQDHRGEARVLHVDREAGGNQLGLPGLEHQRRVEAGAQVQPGRTAGGVGGQRKIAADARIEDAHLQRRGAAVSVALKRAPSRAGARADGASASASAMSAIRPRGEGQLVGARRARAARCARARSAGCPRSRTPCRRPTSLAAIMSRFFFSSLARAFCSTASVSAAKPTTNGPLGAARPRWRGYRWCAPSSRSSVSVVFLIFCPPARAGR